MFPKRYESTGIDHHSTRVIVNTLYVGTMIAYSCKPNIKTHGLSLIAISKYEYIQPVHNAPPIWHLPK